MSKKNVEMNKPIAIGVSVLAWSKAHMVRAYYGTIKQKYGDKVKLHYTDTDSMFLSIQTENLYKDKQMTKNSQRYLILVHIKMIILYFHLVIRKRFMN